MPSRKVFIFPRCQGMTTLFPYAQTKRYNVPRVDSRASFHFTFKLGFLAWNRVEFVYRSSLTY